MTNLGYMTKGSVDNLSHDGASSKILYKHVATIHKSNTLTLLQNKIGNVLYFNAYKNIRDKEYHVITIRQLCEHLEYKGHNDKEIKSALKALIGTVIEWNMLHDEKLENQHWTASTALASASIKPGGICEYSYSFHMRQLLADPVLYGAINIAYQANFRSKYGLALYENCARFVNVKQTGWFTIEFFRELMGVGKESYPIFRDLKRKCIDVAIEEVNAYSNLIVDPVYKKLGRQVAAIKFKIEQREKKPKIKLNESTNLAPSLTPLLMASDTRELIDELVRDFGLSSIQSARLVKSYPAVYIREKLEHINKQKATIKSVPGYLVAALKNDFRHTNNGSLIDISRDNANRAIDELTALKAERFVAAFENEFVHSEVGIDFLTRFINSIRVNEPKLNELYSKTGLSDPKVAVAAMDFCKHKFVTLFEKITTEE